MNGFIFFFFSLVRLAFSEIPGLRDDQFIAIIRISFRSLGLHLRVNEIVLALQYAALI